MKKLYLFLTVLAITLFAQLYAQNGWYQQATINPSPYTITSIEFSDANNGFLIANSGSSGYVYRTSNGGNNWQIDSVFNHNLSKMEIINGNYFIVGSSGKIYKKTSAAGFWGILTSNTTADLNDVQFVSVDTGFVVGDGGIIRRTFNGGTTWTNPVLSSPLTNYDFNSVFFTSANSGIVVGVYNFFQGFAVQTISGGQYWGLPTSMPSKLNKVTFTSPTTGYAVGNGGVIYKSVNSGAGWVLKTSGVTSQLFDISFVNDTMGYACGDNGVILKTVNAGDNWVQQPTPVNSSLNAIWANDALLLWSAGDSSRVLKTTTGGLSLSVSVNDTSVYCNGYALLHANANYNGSGTLQYSWSSNSLLNDTSVYNPTAGPINQTSTFYVTVTDGVVSASDSATITVATLPADSICLVSVDDSLNYNIIVFEKHVQGPIEYYKIFKETTVANVYDSIGFIPADSAGLFIDTAANPAVQAYRYKISSVDSCGNETVMSNPHKTIHLSINMGLPGTWNLIWNNYEGVFINTYRIWRGQTLNNLVLIDSVAGNMTSYTDLNPPAGSIIYQIEIVSSYMCLPYNYKAQTNYNTSRSNKANTGAPPVVSAAFTANPTSGTAPLVVNFSDASMGSIDYYLWSFGDGDTAMTASPSHTYSTAGIYDVTLVVQSGVLFDSITKTAFIDVVSSIEDLDLNSALKVYPNPANQNQEITIEAGDALINTIEIFDMFGRLVYSSTDLKSAKNTICLQGLKGVLDLRITTIGGKVANRRLVVR